MCLSLTPAQKVKNFFPFHSKAALEDVLKILIVGADLLDILVLDFDCQIIVHGTDSLVEYRLDLVFMSLGSSLSHILEQLVLAALCQSLKLALKVLCVKSHFLVPSTVFDNQSLCFSNVALHVLLEKRVENDCKLVSDLLKWLLLKFFDISDYLVVGVLSDKLEL